MTHRVIMSVKAEEDPRHCCAVAAGDTPQNVALRFHAFEEAVQPLMLVLHIRRGTMDKAAESDLFV